jgi:hypothetical protein
MVARADLKLRFRPQAVYAISANIAQMTNSVEPEPGVGMEFPRWVMSVDLAARHPFPVYP